MICLSEPKSIGFFILICSFLYTHKIACRELKKGNLINLGRMKELIMKGDFGT